MILNIADPDWQQIETANSALPAVTEAVCVVTN
jgi:hypothetical protein